MHPSRIAVVIVGSETQQPRLEVMLMELGSNDGVIFPEDE